MIPLGILAVAGAGGAAAGDYELISTTIFGSDTSSVTFSSIASTYKHLQLRIVSKVTGTSLDNMYVSFNGDNSPANGHYTLHRLNGDGSTVTSAGSPTLDYVVLTNGAALSTTANAFSATIIDILDYGSTSKNTTVRALSGRTTDAAWIMLSSGVWLDTSAVTSITIGSNGIYTTGSRFSLYGIKG